MPIVVVTETKTIEVATRAEGEALIAKLSASATTTTYELIGTDPRPVLDEPEPITEPPQGV